MSDEKPLNAYSYKQEIESIAADIAEEAMLNKLCVDGVRDEVVQQTFEHCWAVEYRYMYDMLEFSPNANYALDSGDLEECKFDNFYSVVQHMAQVAIEQDVLSEVLRRLNAAGYGYE